MPARRTRPLDVRDGVSAARPVPARGGDRRRGGVAAARVAAVSVAVVPVPDGRAHVARHDVLHELDDSHGRPRCVGAGDDVRRRRRARPREGKAAQPALAARDAVRVPRLGRGVPRARAEPVVLPALLVPAPPPRVDDGRSAPCSRSRGSGGRTGRSPTRASRSCSSSSLSRCSRTATSRPCSGICRRSPGSRTDETGDRDSSRCSRSPRRLRRSRTRASARLSRRTSSGSSSPRARSGFASTRA